MMNRKYTIFNKNLKSSNIGRKFLILFSFLIIFFSLSFSQSTYYVDGNIGDDAYNGLSPTRGSGAYILYGPKKTIQAAIDAAASGSTIIIASWTYNEHVVIYKPLLLQAAANANVIIQPITAGVTLTINEWSTSAKTVSNLNIRSFGNLTDYPVQVTSGSQNILVQYCNINSTGSVNQGISFTGSNPNISIRNCKFVFDDGDDAIDFNPEAAGNGIASNITISTDTFAVTGNNHTSIKFGALQSGTISNNIFGSMVQLTMVNFNSSSITFSNNTFTPTNPSVIHIGGIYVTRFPVVGSTGTLNSLTITANDFINNNFGVAFDSNLDTAIIYTGTISITYNKFAGNNYGTIPLNKGVAAAFTPIDSAINAINNYWNSDNGPTHTSNTYNVSSHGDPVSDNVTFSPWLKTSRTGLSFQPVLSSTGFGYSSIQAAVNSTLTGSTLTLQGGTFSENVSIPDTKKLTVIGNGYSSASPTIIAPTTGGPTIQINNTTGLSTAQTTISGIAINSFAGLVSDYPVYIMDSAKYVTIKSCKIISTGPAGYGIYCNGSYNNITIGGLIASEGNLFLFDDYGNDVALYFAPSGVDSVTNLSVRYNTFTASGIVHSAGQFGALQTAVFSNNTFGSYLQFWRENRVSTGISITSNTFSPTNSGLSHNGGILFSQHGSDSIFSNLTISQNDFSNNNFGIVFDASFDSTQLFESTISITNNGFSNNNYGAPPYNKAIVVQMANKSDSAFSSINNYWNSNNGPQHSSNYFNVGSQGDPVSDSVIFVPWLLNSKSGNAFAPVTSNEVPPKYYSSIQTAVSKGTSLSKILTIQAGIYKEAVTINQALSLSGPQINIDPTNITGEAARGGGEAIIECENIRNGITITANNVSINGLSIQNPLTAGIYINKGASLDSCYIQFNRILNGTSATGIQFSRNNFQHYFKLLQINYNLVKGNGSVNQGSGGIIIEGRFDYNPDSSIAIVVDHNKIVSNYGSGISIRAAKGSFVTNNTITNNQKNLNGESAIDLQYCNNPLISGNTISAISAPAGDYYGLFLNESKNCTVQSNTINGNSGNITKGIRIGAGGLSVLPSTSNSFQSNIIKNCNEGIRQEGLSALVNSNVFRYNEISGNSQYGFNNLVSQNVDAVNNYWGNDNGPQHSTNNYFIGNQGNSVSDSVSYMPWLKTSMSGVSFMPSPTPVYPVNLVNGLGLNPILKWNKIIGATSYQLQIATDVNFANLLINQTNLTDTIFTTSGLVSTTTYFWRINVTKSGMTSGWSSGWSFMTGSLPPVLVSPLHASIGAAINPILKWNVSIGATSYNLQVSLSSTDWSAPIVNQTGILDTALYLLTPLQNNKMYYWRVCAVNPTGASQWSGIFSFTTILGVATLSFPSDLAQGVSLNPVFKWNRMSGASTYSFQISSIPTDWSSAFTVNNITDTSLSYNFPNASLSNNITYYWRVSASNSGGTGDWSSYRTFTTIIAPPVLNSPVNTAANQPVLPTFVWLASNGANTYNLQVSQSQTDWSNALSVTGLLNTSYTLTTPLQNSIVYYWRISATNTGGTSGWSTVQSFTTIMASPNLPVLLSPINGVSGIPITPTFTWSAVPTAASYTLQISQNQSDWTSALVYSGLTTNAYTPGIQLSNNTTYYWRMNSTNTGGTSAWSNIQSFTTIVAIPAAPVLFQPINSATSQSINPTLSWLAVPTAISYNLQVSLDGINWTSPVVNINTPNTSYTLAITLNKSTTYYWRVNSTNAGGTGTWSMVWNFTTVALPPLPPVHFLPTNTSTGNSLTPTLSWNNSDRATYYALQVTTNPNDWASVVVNVSFLQKTNYNMNNLTNNTTYYWRVRAGNDGGAGSWSDPWSFTTIVAAPTAPNLQSPGNNASININYLTPKVTLSWNATNGATSYDFQISESPIFDQIFYSQVGITSTSIIVNNLRNNVSYYWRVRAVNIGGVSDWSSQWRFNSIIVKVEKLNDIVPGSFSISQNYPNPFNPNTRFEYSLPEVGQVLIKIYDSFGKEVETIYNKIQSAGMYSASWEPHNLPSGVYYYVVSSGKYRAIKKMLYIR